MFVGVNKAMQGRCDTERGGWEEEISKGSRPLVGADFPAERVAVEAPPVMLFIICHYHHPPCVFDI